MSVYLFGKKKTGRVAKEMPPGMKKIYIPKGLGDDTPPMEPVQNVMPASLQEWRSAIALSRLGFDYVFQKPLFGGRRVRGGQVIDFWIYTAPMETACFVQGGYWHNRAKEDTDKLKHEAVKKQYKGNVIILLAPEDKLGSVKDAIAFYREALL